MTTESDSRLNRESDSGLTRESDSGLTRDLTADSAGKYVETTDPPERAGSIRGAAVGPSEIRIGELRSQTRLATKAVYRVIALDESMVVVEVVHAPGLAAGQRFRFTAEAVLAMKLEHEPTDADKV